MPRQRERCTANLGGVGVPHLFGSGPKNLSISYVNTLEGITRNSKQWKTLSLSVES